VSQTPRTVPRLPGIRRGVAELVLALLVASALAAPAQADGVPAGQPLVVVLQNHSARTQPDSGAPRIQSVAARRPLTSVRTVLPVVGEMISASGHAWVHVRLPGRPSGHTGWIRAELTRPTSTGWQITVKLSTRRVTVYRDGRVARRFLAVVGKPSTPTPRGRFFIEEAVALSRSDAGGPFALATSARSHVLQEFDGGPGQIALHGTHNLLGALGTATSHGCVRLSTHAITWLSRRIGSGVPLTIVG
jgi:lipoprotein-anchoring transpeptidase ErfK/SrfK